MVAIIAVLTSIAIPALSGIFGRADSIRAERNAQTLVSTFNAARAAGNSTPFANAGEAIIAITSEPGLHGGGIYTTNQFYISMDHDQITEASLKINPVLSGPPNEENMFITR